ncbi:MAG: hypothetical protein PHW14_04930 [Candidatus Omnitrophica bacterium]|nr:hypothetical protein [Candidatus Omnitrophota bacterium]
MRTSIIAIFLMCAVCAPAWARPVSYAGGWTLATYNDGDSDSGIIHYSPKADRSLGIRAEYFREKDWLMTAGQFNALVKRWNEPGWQANAYVKSGAGWAYKCDGPPENRSELALFSGFAADWENRRYYISYENRLLYAGHIHRDIEQKARVGIAPYIGGYGDIHTWLMCEVRYFPGMKHDQFMVTPLVRFFKGAVMAEVGCSIKGDVLFNWVMFF